VPAPIGLGLQIADFNFPGVGPERLFETLAEIAATAENAGFDSLFVMDHLHQIRGVGPREHWMLEGNTVLAGLAARTSRASLGLLVGGVTYRNPALLAKITTTIDVISGGRAILGIGAAWNQEEHDAYGIDFPPISERFERLEDALQIARLMFTQEESSFEGRHHRVQGALNNPRPIRGAIPIMIGGSGERKTLRLVAQYADACNVFGNADGVRHLMSVLERHCEDVARDPADITKTRLGTVLIARTHEEARQKFERLRGTTRVVPERLESMTLAGDPGTVAEQAQAFLDAGLDGLIVNLPDAYDLETVALVGETLGRLTPARA
jgi:F420-dependent oxidoreductase-like protein